MKKNFIVLGVIAVIITLLVVSYLYIFSTPDYDTPIIDTQNTQLYNLIQSKGIDNAVVDVQADKILMSVEIPQGIDEDSEISFCLGVALSFAYPDKEIILAVENRGESKTISTTPEEIVKMIDGAISLQELKNSTN